MLEVDAPTLRLPALRLRRLVQQGGPRLGGALSDREAYDYLPRSVAYLPPTPVLRRMLADAGYSGVGIRPLAGGLSQLLFATRTGVPVTA
jgi:ubiquinone/menaquinone biosynthesis C-methylase UbiE